MKTMLQFILERLMLTDLVLAVAFSVAAAMSPAGSDMFAKSVRLLRASLVALPALVIAYVWAV